MSESYKDTAELKRLLAYSFALYRNRAGLTQKQLAEITKITQSDISKLERGKSNPSIDTLIRLADGIDCNMQITFTPKNADISGKNSESIELNSKASSKDDSEDEPIPFANSVETDIEFTICKQLALRLRKLARLDRLRIDESEHASGLNLHLYRYLEYCGIDKLEYVKNYLSHIQPFMISEFKSQEKFESAICILDNLYRISVYIKVDATRGEEIVVSFHENNINGIAKASPRIRDKYVYVFADNIGASIRGQNAYSLDLFITRGIQNVHIDIPGQRYDDQGFLVKYSAIENSLLQICNQYLEDLYTSDLDFDQISQFSSIQQLSFTSYGRDNLSNISLLIDSLLIQSRTIAKQVADSALCIYCSSLTLTESDKTDLIDVLNTRYMVNSSRLIPELITRIEYNISAI